jgi:hypothetical protein
MVGSLQSITHNQKNKSIEFFKQYFGNHWPLALNAKGYHHQSFVWIATVA